MSSTPLRHLSGLARLWLPRSTSFLASFGLTALSLGWMNPNAEAAAPATPSNFSVNYTYLDTTPTRVGFRYIWDDNATDELGYQTGFSYNGSGFQALAVVDSNSQDFYTYPFNISGVFNYNTSVVFKVRAFNFNSSGNAEFSSDPNAFVTWNFLNVPLTFNAPSNLEATSQGDGSVLLTFTDNSNSELGFDIEYKRSTDSTWISAGQVLYNTTSFKLMLATAGTYDFRVRAYNGVPAATTYATRTNFVVTGGAGLGTPTNLQIVSSTTDGYSFTWTDNSTSEDGYQILYRVAGQSYYNELAKAPANSTSKAVLTAGNTSNLEFAVRATRSVAGKSAYAVTPISNVVTAGPSNSVFIPPTNLTFTNPTNEKIQLHWTDNTSFEDNYEISYSLNSGGSFSVLTYVPANTNTYLLSESFSIGTSIQFRVRAVKLTTWGVVSSASTYSATVTATTPLILTPPTNLAATLPAEGKVKLTWTDNSTQEGNYEIQYRFVGDTSFANLGYVAANTTTYTTDAPGGVPIEFRVRATLGSGPDFFSEPSNSVSATPYINGPTNLVATSPGEARVNLSWTDNSAIEGNYEVMWRIKGNTSFTTFNYYAANTTSLTNLVIAPGYTIQIQVRATRGVNAEFTSAVSNLVEITAPFTAPSALAVSSSTDRQVTLTWQDNSTAETSYGILCKASNASTYNIAGIVAANSTSFVVKSEDTDGNYLLTPNTSYDFQVVALVGDGETAPISLTAVTKDGLINNSWPALAVNQSFSFNFQFTEGQGTITSFTRSAATPLPAGLTFDSATRAVSGIPTQAGAFPTIFDVTWSNGWTSSYTLHLRPQYAPAAPKVVTSVGSRSYSLSGTTTEAIPLAGLFSDPDTQSAVRIFIPGADGTAGARSVTVILNDSQTPQTVANFMGYVNRGDYNGAIFHRLVKDFVLQGGGYKISASPAAFVSVTDQAPVNNEPGISNILGTVAMAKVGGNPNSATNEFFFSLNNNSSNLDNQNGGFTVFGRVATPDLPLLTTTINALPLPPTNQYAVTLDGASTTFNAVPMNAATAPATMDQTKLLKMDSITTGLPILSYSVTGNTSPSVATAVISGGNLNITALTAGNTTVTLSATDLDANVTSQTFTITVGQPFSEWIATQPGVAANQRGATDDPDHDGLNNLQEFAFMGTPGTAGDSAAFPVASSVTSSGNLLGKITFKFRKGAPNLLYEVVANSNLSSTWNTIWNSNVNGMTASNVTISDQGSYILVTVADSVSIVPGTPRFLKVKLTQN